MMWADGTTYEGKWKDGKLDGLGKIVYREYQKIGIFKNNKLIKD